MWIAGLFVLGLALGAAAPIVWAAVPLSAEERQQGLRRLDGNRAESTACGPRAGRSSVAFIGSGHDSASSCSGECGGGGE
jgi:hypothetical protein